GCPQSLGDHSLTHAPGTLAILATAAAAAGPVPRPHRAHPPANLARRRPHAAPAGRGGRLGAGFLLRPVRAADRRAPARRARPRAAARVRAPPGDLSRAGDDRAAAGRAVE